MVSEDLARAKPGNKKEHFFTHRIGLFVFRRVIGIVDIISHIITRDASLPNSTSETTGDYRYHSHHNQRNETDAHINGVRSCRRMLRCLVSRADKAASIYDMRWWVLRRRNRLATIAQRVSPAVGINPGYQRRKVRTVSPMTFRDVCSISVDQARRGASSRWHRSLGPDLGAPTATGGVGTSAMLKDVRRGMQCDVGGGQPRSYILRSHAWLASRRRRYFPDGSKKRKKTHARGPRASTRGCPLHCCASAAWVRQVGRKDRSGEDTFIYFSQ